MTALERQAAQAGITYEIVEQVGNGLVRIRVDGKEYLMSTHWSNYGALVHEGISIFQLLSRLANLKRARARKLAKSRGCDLG